MTGVALWVDVSHNMACIQFGGCKERGIPPYCLEEAEDQKTNDNSLNVGANPGDGIRLWYENQAKEKAAEEAEKQSMVTEQTAKLGRLYRIVKVPQYWQKISGKKQYPSLGGIGRLMNIHDHFGVLRLSDGMQRFVPFDCMEPVTIRIPPLQDAVINISDDELIKKMVEKPLSTLKIIRGLAHMNKDYRLRQFLDRGVHF